jgi:hypothetical protein
LIDEAPVLRETELSASFAEHVENKNLIGD